jgi:transcriptional regulator with XRE-family HTH domain
MPRADVFPRALGTRTSRSLSRRSCSSLSKSRLAALLGTSRSQVDRLLDPTRDVTLSTLQRAAALLGRKIQIQLV